MNDVLCPDERDGARVVAVDESIDVISELLDTGEAGSGAWPDCTICRGPDQLRVTPPISASASL